MAFSAAFEVCCLGGLWRIVWQEKVGVLWCGLWWAERHEGVFVRRCGALGAFFLRGHGVGIHPPCLGKRCGRTASARVCGVWDMLLLRTIFVAGRDGARSLAAEMAAGEKRIGQDGVRPARFYRNYSLS